jgi:hypothetical protein
MRGIIGPSFRLSTAACKYFEPANFPSRPGAAWRENQQRADQSEWRKPMDVSDYFTGFLKVEDFADGETMQATITKVEEGKFDKLVLTLDNGSLFSLNVTNGRATGKAYGYNSDDWIGKRIELSVGEALFKGEKQPSIVLKPLTASLPVSERRVPAEPDISDDIPF